MACRLICRYCLILIQTRLMRTWFQSTISMLENSLTLYYFTLEQPWPGFSPDSALQKLRTMKSHLDHNSRKIDCLTRMLYCRGQFSHVFWRKLLKKTWFVKKFVFFVCESSFLCARHKKDDSHTKRTNFLTIHVFFNNFRQKREKTVPDNTTHIP